MFIRQTIPLNMQLLCCFILQANTFFTKMHYWNVFAKKIMLNFELWYHKKLRILKNYSTILMGRYLSNLITNIGVNQINLLFSSKKWMPWNVHRYTHSHRILTSFSQVKTFKSTFVKFSYFCKFVNLGQDLLFKC